MLLQGVSPALADELCMRAGVSPDTPAGELHDGNWAALFEQWQCWIRRVLDSDFQASFDITMILTKHRKQACFMLPYILCTC